MRVSGSLIKTTLEVVNNETGLFGKYILVLRDGAPYLMFFQGDGYTAITRYSPQLVQTHPLAPEVERRQDFGLPVPAPVVLPGTCSKATNPAPEEKERFFALAKECPVEISFGLGDHLTSPAADCAVEWWSAVCGQVITYLHGLDPAVTVDHSKPIPEMAVWNQTLAERLEQEMGWISLPRAAA